MSFGSRLRLARAARGMTQAALAARVGGEFKQQNISGLENDESEASRFCVRLARALDVDPLWLESGEGSMDAAPRDIGGMPVDDPLIAQVIAILANLTPPYQQTVLAAAREAARTHIEDLRRGLMTPDDGQGEGEADAKKPPQFSRADRSRA